MSNKVSGSIVEGVKRSRDKANQDYLSILGELEKMTDKQEILCKLIDLFEDKMIDEDVFIEVFHAYLNTDFFNESSASETKNSISFSNGVYIIGFDIKKKIIKFDRVEMVGDMKPLPIREDMLDFNELWREYEDSGQKDSIKRSKLIDSFSRMNKESTLNLLLKRGRIIRDMEEFAVSLKESIENKRLEFLQWEKDQLIFEEEDKAFSKIIDDFQYDLIEFILNDWGTRFSTNVIHLNRPGWARTPYK